MLFPSDAVIAKCALFGVDSNCLMYVRFLSYFCRVRENVSAGSKKGGSCVAFPKFLPGNSLSSTESALPSCACCSGSRRSWRAWQQAVASETGRSFASGGAKGKATGKKIRKVICGQEGEACREEVKGNLMRV